MSAIIRLSREKLVIIGMVALLLAGSLMAIVCVRYLQRHYSAIAHYNEVRLQIRRSQQAKDAAIFFGDSLMEGFATSSVMATSENFGITSDTLDRAIARIPQYNLAGARIIVLEFGINDIWLQQTEGFAQKYKQILNLLPRGVPVVAMGISAITAKGEQTLQRNDTRQIIPALNRQIAEACGRRTECLFVDTTQSMRDVDGFLSAQYAEADGVHLSTAGYRMWAAVLRPLLASRQTPGGN